jgi:hypothetical protein
LCRATKRLFTASGMSRSRSSPTSLSSGPSPTPTADSYRAGCFQHWPCSCFFQRWRWDAGRQWWGDRGRRVADFASTLQSSFPFLVSWWQRRRRELSLLVFFILVCFVIWTRIYLICGLWYFKWPIKLIMLIWYLSMVWMIIFCLSIYVVCL